MTSEVQRFQPRKEGGDSRHVDIGKSDAKLAFAIVGTGRLEHGAGQGKDGGILHQRLQGLLSAVSQQ